MRKSNKNTTIILLIAIVLFVGIVAYYKVSKLHLVDKDAYRRYNDKLITVVEQKKFKSNTDFRTYIEKWATRNGLMSTTDQAGNIIISRNATEGNEAVPPTIVCVNYNYQTLEDDMQAITSAQAIASSKVTGGPASVIFMNNEQNKHEGAKNISAANFPENSRIIYLDEGKSSYISNLSFASVNEDISIPYATEERSCDTAIKIKITGIKTGEPDVYIGDQPNPIAQFNTVVSRYKAKSVPYQIADLKVGNEGDQYPSSVEFTLLINSYNLADAQSYLDKRVESFNESYLDDYPDAKYEYKVISDESKMTGEALSKDTLNKLNILLYTIKSGNYRFDESNVIKDHSEGDTFGINAITGISVDGDTMHVALNTQGYNDKFLDQIIRENESAASFAEATLSTSERLPAFRDNDEAFALELANLYSKSNNVTSKDITLNIREDKDYTECSLLSALQPSADTIHISMDEESGIKITNTILNYMHSSALDGLLNV